METREAIAEDYEAYARLMPELGVDDALPPRERFATEMIARTIVAVEGAEVVGYALYEVIGTTGYVRNIVSDPARRRSGIGRALMAALRELFASRGATAWCLNVKLENAAAIALYERCGMTVEYRTSVLRIPRDAPLAPPDPDLRLEPAPPDDDAPTERALHLLPGQLATARAKSGRQVVRLVRDRETVGIAVFMASVPGAFPFRVSEARLGASLLAQVRRLAPPEAPFVQISTENDDALRTAMLALGLEVRFELFHMSGPI